MGRNIEDMLDQLPLLGLAYGEGGLLRVSSFLRWWRKVQDSQPLHLSTWYVKILLSVVTTYTAIFCLQGRVYIAAG